MKHILSLILAATALSATAAPTDTPTDTPVAEASASAGTEIATPSATKYQQWGTHNPNAMQVRLNIGYAMGGTTPLPLPAEIRSIDRFKPYGGGNIGIEASKMFGKVKKRWGIATGVHGFLHGMKTGAHVKGYQMSITMDQSEMAGYFTGIDETNVRLLGLTIPVKAVWRASHRWTIEVGPYLQLFKKDEFEGKVYDGYLRVDTPTGEKINIAPDTPATYDFSQDMRWANWGFAFNFDWKATRHWSIYGDLDWGVSGVFNSNFETIAFKMYSIYANVGLAYSIF